MITSPSLPAATALTPRYVTPAAPAAIDPIFMDCFRVDELDLLAGFRMSDPFETILDNSSFAALVACSKDALPSPVSRLNCSAGITPR